MADSKKRSHEYNGDLNQEKVLDGEPVAKKPKLCEGTTPSSGSNANTEIRAEPSPVLSFAGYTDPGSRYGNLNQDCHYMDRIALPGGNFATVVAVFDGHGKHGETASRLACEYFQRELKRHLTQPKHISMRDHEKQMRNMFEGAHKRILAEYEKLTTLDFDGYTFTLTMTADRVDFYQSAKCPYVLLQDFGTTAVICVYWEETQKLLVANCGDSDALIGRWDVTLKAVQPNLLTISDNVSCSANGEQERIKRDFGRKTKFGGGYLSPNDATYGFHSLAMTRALGHKFLEKYGVTWDPHIRLFQTTTEDLVLVVASDGLFDVVNSKAILSVAAERQPSPSGPRVLSPSEASERLVHLALNNWQKQFNSSDVADNTTVCVLKLSAQFDSEVPERSELTNSGTSFSPASTSLHAFEAEIEETSKDILDPSEDSSHSSHSASSSAEASSPSSSATPNLEPASTDSSPSSTSSANTTSISSSLVTSSIPESTSSDASQAPSDTLTKVPSSPPSDVSTSTPQYSQSSSP